MSLIQYNMCDPSEISNLNKLVNYFSDFFSNTHDSRYVSNMFTKNYFSPDSTSKDIIKFFFMDQTGGFAYYLMIINNEEIIVSDYIEGAKVELYSKMSRIFWIFYTLNQNTSNLCDQYIENLSQLFIILNKHINNNETIARLALEQKFSETSRVDYGANAYTLLLKILAHENVRNNPTAAQKLAEICQYITDLFSKDALTLVRCLNIKATYIPGKKAFNGFYHLMNVLIQISSHNEPNIARIYTNLIS